MPGVLVPGPYSHLPYVPESRQMFTLRNTQSARFVYHFIPSISRFLNIQRRTLTASVNMKDKFLYISFPEQPIYFKTQRLADIVKTESRISGGLIKHLNKDAPVYIIFPRTETGSDILENYIRTAIQAQALYRKSAIWSDLNFAHCLKFSGKRNTTENKSAYKRGVCIYLGSGFVFKDSFVEPLLTFLKEHDLDASKVTMSGEDRLIWQTLGELTEDREQYPLLCVDRNEVNESSCYESPIFTESELTPVHHTFQEARNVLEKVFITKHVHTGKCIRRFAGIYAYCRYYIDRKWHILVLILYRKTCRMPKGL